MLADSAYFSKNCTSLIAADKNRSYNNFKRVLDELGMCARRSTKVCNVQVCHHNMCSDYLIF